MYLGKLVASTNYKLKIMQSSTKISKTLITARFFLESQTFFKTAFHGAHALRNTEGYKNNL